MDILLTVIFFGAVIGWLSTQLVHGTGIGLLADTLIGILGALIAYFRLANVALHLAVALFPAIAAGALGAALSLVIVRLIDNLLADVE